jgi:hypothetical protein
MKKNDIFSFIGIIIIFSYVGYREFLLNQYIKETEQKVLDLRSQVVGFINKKNLNNLERAALSEGQLTRLESDQRNIRINKSIKTFIEGYFCSSGQEGHVFKFELRKKGKVKDKVTIWMNASSSIELANSKDPYVVATYKIQPETIRIRFKTLPGDELQELDTQTFHLMIAEYDRNDSTKVVTITDNENLVYSKENCIE